MELLVVIAIIAFLVGILVPALGLVKRLSTNLRQKSIFHGLETGLELFSKDFDGYPESTITSDSGSTPYVCGAQHLVEAIVGRDERGFEPRTGWYAPNDSVYNSNVPSDLYDDTSDDSLNRRKPVYLELKKGTGVFTMRDLYGTGNCGDVYESDPGGKPHSSPVFTDVFRKKKITLSNGDSVKVGAPILYYKADSASRYFKVSPMPPFYDEWIYNAFDNDPIVKLGTLEDPAVQHHFASDYTAPAPDNRTGVEIFYDAITNPNVQTHEKPFNAKTFILISAGWDGIFGTKDDISNFDY